MSRCTNCFTKCGPTSPRTARKLSIGGDFYCEDCYPLCVKIQKRLSSADSRGAGAGIVLSPPKAPKPAHLMKARTMPRRHTTNERRPVMAATTFTPMTIEVTDAADPIATFEDDDDDADAPPKCLRCRATAYISDSVSIGANRVAHKSCMRCVQCNTVVRMTGPDAAAVRNGNFFCAKFPACESQVLTTVKDGYQGQTVKKVTRNTVDFFEALASTEPPTKPRSKSVAPLRSSLRSTSPEKSPASPPTSNGVTKANADAKADNAQQNGEEPANSRAAHSDNMDSDHSDKDKDSTHTHSDKAKDSLEAPSTNGDSDHHRTPSTSRTSPKYPTLPAQRTRQPTSRLAGLFKRKKAEEPPSPTDNESQSSVSSYREDEDSDFDFDKAGVDVLREAVRDLQLQLKASQASLQVQQQANLTEVAELKMQHRNSVSHFQTLIAERDLRVAQLEADVHTQKKKARHFRKKAASLKKGAGGEDDDDEAAERDEKAKVAVSVAGSQCSDDDGSCVHQLLMEQQAKNFERDFLTMKVQLCNAVDRMHDLEMENNVFRQQMPEGGADGADNELSVSVTTTTLSKKEKKKKEKKDKKKRKSEKGK